MLHVTSHMSHVACHMLHVTCHMSRVMCHVSHVTCHKSHIFFFKGTKLIDGGSVINRAYPIDFFFYYLVIIWLWNCRVVFSLDCWIGPSQFITGRRPVAANHLRGHEDLVSVWRLTLQFITTAVQIIFFKELIILTNGS